MDFDVKRRSRVCSVTERELGPGETYYSVLIEQDEEVVRLEISSSAWEGPPESTISWWQARIPERDPNRFFWAPDNVIIDYFESFADDPDKEVERYVLALLLIQKRIFRLTDSETDEEGTETMYLACSRKKSQYEISVANPPTEEIESIQEELVNLLFSDEPFDEVEVDLESETDEEPPGDEEDANSPETETTNQLN